LAGELRILTAAGFEELPDGRRTQCYEFHSGLYHDAIAALAEPAGRVDGQRSLAQAIEAIYGSRRKEKAVDLAWRYEQCRAWSTAIEYLQLAASRAMDQAAPSEALTFLTRARAHVRKLAGAAERADAQFEVLLQLAPAAMAASDAATATTAWGELSDLATTPARQRRLAGALVHAAAQRADR
jgi:hypothetical protein